MSRRGDAATQQRNQQTLKSLLKLEPNKICADCKIHKRTLPIPHPEAISRQPSPG